MRRALFLIVSLAGCTTESIYMKNPQTGAVVKCGTPHANTLAEPAVQAREAQCIQDYKEQGYVRVPGPK